MSANGPNTLSPDAIVLPVGGSGITSAGGNAGISFTATGLQLSGATVLFGTLLLNGTSGNPALQVEGLSNGVVAVFENVDAASPVVHIDGTAGGLALQLHNDNGTGPLLELQQAVNAGAPPAATNSFTIRINGTNYRVPCVV